ncbi:hypothetical protein CSUB01_03271 [Colletotrichum sublineola]|uniref:Uncharacterized protein n=1 Tax=Colletotrichum sublineola TaxID=1173701 RepID=A0A066XFB8_COLSU|nr:hypothetical protein CSUB01_03271 [Colletotrichum sublineola]
MRRRKLPIALPSYQVYAIHRGSPSPARSARQSLLFTVAVPPHSSNRIASHRDNTDQRTPRRLQPPAHLKSSGQVDHQVINTRGTQTDPALRPRLRCAM